MLRLFYKETYMVWEVIPNIRNKIGYEKLNEHKDIGVFTIDGITKQRLL